MRNILVMVLCTELLAVCYYVVEKLGRAEPPTVDLSRLDPLTTADLQRLQLKTLDGNSADWRELAEAYLGNGYYVAAEQCFRHTADLNPRDLLARYGQGFCLERIGKTSDAISVLSQIAAVADSELASTCWYQIGRCFLREEKAEDAEAAFRKIPKFQPAAYHLAKLLIRTDRAPEALPILEQQLKRLPNSMKLLQLRMHAAEAMGDTALAAKLRDREDRAEYQLVLEYGQSFISMFASRYGLSALLSTAMQLRTEGSLEERQAALGKALEVISPNHLWQYRSVLVAAAYVELGLGNLDAAEALITDIEQYTQTGIDTLDLNAGLAEAKGDYKTAYDLWLRSAAMKPNADIYFTLSKTRADIDEGTRRRHGAMADLRGAMEAFRANDIETATEAMQLAEVVLAHEELYLFYLGEIERVLGHRDAAMKAYDACLAKNPDHGRSLMRKRQLLDNQQRTGKTASDVLP